MIDSVHACLGEEHKQCTLAHFLGGSLARTKGQSVEWIAAQLQSIESVMFTSVSGRACLHL